MSLNVIEASLGTTKNVETIDGTSEITIPPGTPSGAKLRLKEKGLHLRTGGRGDHFVRIKIVPPKNLSAKAKELFEKLKNEIN